MKNAKIKRRSFIKRSSLPTMLISTGGLSSLAYASSTSGDGKKVDSIKVTFKGEKVPPKYDNPPYKGRDQGSIFTGDMEISYEDGSSDTVDIESGGYRDPSSDVKKDPNHDTSWPSGCFNMENKVKGTVKGFYAPTPGTGRTAMYLHKAKLPKGGSHGCIAVPKQTKPGSPDWETIKGRICDSKNTIKLTICYEGVTPTGNAPDRPGGN